MLKRLPAKIYSQFPALKHKNYRLYFFGQLISFTGSWLHGVAHGWLVFQLTHSAFWLGFISAISALPVFFLSLYGGFLVDRYNRKKLLFITQSIALILAFVLGILTLTHLITLPILIIITFLAGITDAIDNPVTQAFVVDVVGKEDLPSAVGLNSTLFNTGRIIGPAIAGFLIALIGVGNIFLVNAASFLAILISLYFIQISNFTVNFKDKNAFSAIKEAVSYANSHPLLRILLATAGIGALFCFSQATIMPAIATNVFQQGSSGLGRLLSATGVGAFTGSLIISSKFKKIRTFWFITVGNAIFISSMFIFSFTSHLTVALICLFFSGLGLTLQFSSLYAYIQKLVKEEFRGRISSMYVFLFIGLSPLGNLFIGSTASILGPQLAIRLCLLIISGYAAAGFFYLPHIHKKYKAYKKQKTSIYAFIDS